MLLVLLLVFRSIQSSGALVSGTDNDKRMRQSFQLLRLNVSLDSYRHSLVDLAETVAVHSFRMTAANVDAILVPSLLVIVVSV